MEITNASSIHELSTELLKNIGVVVDTYRNIGEEEKKELRDILKL